MAKMTAICLGQKYIILEENRLLAVLNYHRTDENIKLLSQFLKNVLILLLVGYAQKKQKRKG